MASKKTNWFLFCLCLYSAGLFFAIIVTPLLKPKFFFDGLIYASISKNLSLGYGTLWRPFLSHSLLNPFYEHPPLALYFQSLLFKVFGQGLIVERLHVVILALGQFGLISWYWLKQQKESALSLGLLLLLWLMIPLNWVYINNYLIGTLTLFTTLASLILLIRTQSKFALFLLYLLSSIIILIAFLSDGPMAFFPLAIPLTYRIVYKPKSIFTGFLETLCFVAILTLVFFSFYWMVPEALFNTQQFLKQQVLSSMIGLRSHETAGIKHLYLLYLYFKGYAIVSFFVIACIAIAAKIDKQPILSAIRQSFKNKDFLFFLVITLASSLPIALGGRQSFRYIMPSAPFFALAMMSICWQPFEKIIHYYAKIPKLFKGQYEATHLLFALIITTIGIHNLLPYYRSDIPNVIKDIRTITSYCAKDDFCSSHGILSIDNYEIFWMASGYLARYSTVMMSITPELDFPYFLGFQNAPIPAGYQLVNLPLSVFKLAIHDQPLDRLKTVVANPIQSF
jgi:4-amino-4-deoxy-L-arabinose transferase-like glycosyltransferase